MISKMQNLAISQMDTKLSNLGNLETLEILPEGWVNSIRSALGMNLRQLGAILGITSQSVREIEMREKNGSLTLNGLREVADALDLKLVYALLPNKGSLKALIEARAKILAEEIVMRTSQSMKLENQEVSKERLQESILEKTKEIQKEMPSYLWD